MTRISGKGWQRPGYLAAVLLLGTATSGHAVAGVSPYLPLSLAPEVESRVEQLLVLAGVPVMTRPIRVATVRDALSGTCPTYHALCRQVRRDLAPYLQAMAITGFTLPTTYRWIRSDLGRTMTMHPFMNGRYPGSGPARTVMAEAGLDGQSQFRRILEYVRALRALA